MRLATIAIAALALSATAGSALAQIPGQQQQQPGQRGQAAGEQPETRTRAPRIAPLRGRANAGPCPFVKVLYDAARYVELTDGRASSANVGYTGEIEGVTADCSYREAEPITLDIGMLFRLGRGPQATTDQRTYRYWVAVTERNNAVLAKEYFDLPVNFEGAATASVQEERTIVIPRADVSVSGGNFEVLVGFEVTPDMAEFNRTGSRFRVNAGQAIAPAAPPAQ